MNLSVVLKLPTSLLIELFSNWLFVEDLARFDSALTRKRAVRQRYLEVLSSPHLISNSKPECQHIDSISYLNWLSLRQVSVRNLYLQSADLLNFNVRCPSMGSRLKLHTIEQLEVQGNEDLYSFVKEIITHARCIQILKFSCLVWLTYPRLRGFLKICHSTLEVLQIDTVKYLYGGHLVKLVPYFSNLRELSLGRCELSKPFIEALIVHCRKLTKFQFASSPVHTDTLLRFIQSFTLTEPAKAINHKYVTKLTTTEPRLSNQLTSIALTYNTGVRLNRIGTCIADNCTALTQLTLVGDYDISDALSAETLIYIAQRCKQLRYIDVSKNNYIENSAIICIAECCTELTHLVIHSCRRISDDAVGAIAQHCAHLELLDVSWCDNITNTSLQLLSNAKAGLRHNMRELKINSCYRITSKENLLQLIGNCRLLTIDKVATKFTNLS